MRKITKTWDKYLNSGLPESATSSSLVYKVQLLNSFSLIGITSALVFGFINLKNGNLLTGTIEITASFLGVLNVLIFRKTLNFNLAANSILFGMILLLNYLLIAGGYEKTGIFWFFTFPALAFFFTGLKKGVWWMLFLYGTSLLSYAFYQYGILSSFAYNFIELRQMFFSLFAVSMLMLFYEKLRRENEKKIEKNEKDQIIKNLYDQQLEEAENIQKTFIPDDSINSKILNISGFYKPSIEIGGDYFDFLDMGKNYTGIIIADIMGKGIPAALVMVKFRTILKMLLRKSITNPIKILSEANHILCGENKDFMFITAILAVFDEKNKILTIVNAGHIPMLWYSEKSKEIKNIFIKTKPLGISEKTVYKSLKTRLNKGDIILLFTDGLTETFNSSGKMYGEENLKKQIIKYSKLKSEEIIEKIMSDVYRFSGKKHLPDDISMVIMKIK